MPVATAASSRRFLKGLLQLRSRVDRLESLSTPMRRTGMLHTYTRTHKTYNLHSNARVHPCSLQIHTNCNSSEQKPASFQILAGDVLKEQCQWVFLRGQETAFHRSNIKTLEQDHIWKHMQLAQRKGGSMVLLCVRQGLPLHCMSFVGLGPISVIQKAGLAVLTCSHAVEERSGTGGGSTGLAPAMVWAAAWLGPTVDHLASWGGWELGTPSFPCEPRQVPKSCMVPGDKGTQSLLLPPKAHTPEVLTPSVVTFSWDT